MSDANDDFGDENSGPAELRKALKKANDEKAQMASQLKELMDAKRSGDVAELFRAAELDPGLVKFYGDGDATPEAVAAWKSENAKFFGIEQKDPVTPAQQAAIDAASQASRLLNQAPPAMTGSPEDILNQYENASIEDLFSKGLLDKPRY